MPPEICLFSWMPTSQLQDDTNKVDSSVGETKRTGGWLQAPQLRCLQVTSWNGSLWCDKTALKLLVQLCQEFTRCWRQKITELALGSARQLVKGVPTCRKFCGALIRQWNATLLQFPLFSIISILWPLAVRLVQALFVYGPYGWASLASLRWRGCFLAHKTHTTFMA